MAETELAVLEALARAASQQVMELKSAEGQLAEWETKPGFYSILLQVIVNHSLDPTVRWMAALTFKNGVDRYWRKTAPNAISEDEKRSLRRGLLGTFQEPVNQVAVQLAVLIAKAARFDFPMEWPELLPTLTDMVVKGDDPIAQHRALLVMHHVIKTLASKRLAGDRRIFHQLSSSLYVFILNLSNSAMDTFFMQFQNNDQQCQGTLEKALLTIRIMRKLTIHGFKQPKDTQEVVMFVSSVFQRAKDMLVVRKRLGDSSPMLELVEKVVIHLTKVLLSLLEDHPFSFVPFIQPSLSFCVSLLFTPEGEGLLFPRLVIQCLNLMKGVLTCIEYKISSKRPEGEDPSPDAVQANALKEEFFKNEVLTEICTKLVTQYFLLTQEELELWDSDPEGFVNEDGGESWRYNLRPCTEALFLALFHAYRDALAPILLQLLYANHQPVPPHDLSAVLRKDAVYLAIGLGAFDLYDEVDMDKWFPTLQQELSIRDGHYRIIQRRAAWLLGEWSGVKLSSELRPALYRSFMPLLQGDEDFVVRLTAANALKRAIDDFDFDTTQFMELLETIVSLLFNLLREAKECDTKMHVLTVLSFIVERVGLAIRPYSSSLVQYLPLLWQESANHNMLRCAIVSTLVHCVRALVTEHISAFLYHVLDICLDTTQEAHVYLLEDGLELWLVMLENSSTLTPAMLHLTKRIPPILEGFSEHLEPCCLIMQTYVVLSPFEFAKDYGETFLASCYELLSDLKPEGVVTIYKFVEICLVVEPISTIQMAMPIILEVFHRVCDGGGYPMVLSALLSIMSRVLIHSMDVFCQIVERVSQDKGETAETCLDLILTSWLERMGLVTNNEKRKLLSVALTSLLTANSPVVLSKITPLIRNVVETLNDITELGENDEQVDSLMLPLQIEDESEQLAQKTEHDRRMKKLCDHDPVYNVQLNRYLKAQMDEFAKRIGKEATDSLLNALDPELLEELRLYSS